MGLYFAGPTRSAPGAVCQWSGPERFLWVRMPALSTVRPLIVYDLRTNELLSNLTLTVLLFSVPQRLERSAAMERLELPSIAPVAGRSVNC
jgi:hypothetical protein